jgi:hypothetical protein
LNSYTNREPADGEEEHPIVIEDDGSDSDSEAEGTEAEGSEADRKGPELGTHFAFNAMVSSNDQQMMEMTVVIARRSYLRWRISSNAHLPKPIPNLRRQTGIKQMI